MNVSNLRWFQQIELSERPLPRACLATALTTPYVGITN